jgi:hypothetical protein
MYTCIHVHSHINVIHVYNCILGDICNVNLDIKYSLHKFMLLSNLPQILFLITQILMKGNKLLHN